MKSVCLLFSLVMQLSDSVPNDIIFDMIRQLGETIEWVDEGQMISLTKDGAIQRLRKIIEDLDHGKVQNHHTSYRDTNGYGILEVVGQRKSYRLVYFYEQGRSKQLKIQKVKITKRLIE